MSSPPTNTALTNVTAIFVPPAVALRVRASKQFTQLAAYCQWWSAVSARAKVVSQYRAAREDAGGEPPDMFCVHTVGPRVCPLAQPVVYFPHRRSLCRAREALPDDQYSILGFLLSATAILP